MSDGLMQKSSWTPPQKNAFSTSEWLPISKIGLVRLKYVGLPFLPAEELL